MKFKAKKNRRITDKEKIGFGCKKIKDEIPDAVKLPPAKVKYECKRGKGNHYYKIAPGNKKKFNSKYILEYECIYCGHREINVNVWPVNKSREVYNGRICFSYEKDIEKCEFCGKELVPDLECIDEKGMWQGYTYKYDCDCVRKDLRVSIG